MEIQYVVGECPGCKYPLLMERNKYGDNEFECIKCRKTYLRWGHAGPLCEINRYMGWPKRN